MDQLPLELLWKVLGYLSTYDLVQFCRAYGDNKPLKEKRLIQLVDFSRRFELHNFNLCHFIKTDLNYSYIKCLNVSYLHWIPADELRKLIKQLENLHTLLAIDTKLGLKDKDISGYIKLRKIAVSIEDSDFEHSTVIAARQLINLQSLSLKITQKKAERSGIILFFREIKHLEELWIYDDNKSSNRIDYSQLVCMLKNLKKFVVKSRTVLPYFDFKCDNLFSTFGCKRSDTATEIIFEKIKRKVEDSNRSIFDPRNGNELENSWDIFQTLLKDLPCGPKESKELYLHNDINSINFEELNFCHSIIVCNYKYVTGARIILLSKNASKLKRLSFRSCLLQDFSLMNMTTDEHLSFKKPRIGVQMNTNIIHHPFLPVANNVKCIEVLEIENCPWCAGSAVIASYPIISAFENLRKLTLEVPILINGLFLKEVFMKCQRLESIDFNCIGHNEKFLLNLYQNLKHATSLRDLRLEHKEISIDKLLDTFNNQEHKKLLRVFLKCDALRSSGRHIDAFHSFMENNPQLLFFVVVASENTVKQNSDIQKVLNSFKKGNSAKVFYIKNDITPFTGGFPIPSAHNDMIFRSTNVSVINIDEF